MRGSARDGHEFLAQAEAAGAVAAIVEDAGRTTLPSIVVREGRRAAAIAAAAAFDDPAKKLKLAAVTGTNGKTTVVGILRHLLDKPDARSASIGTLGILLGSEGVPLGGGASLTTPGPSSCSARCARLVDRGVRTVAMELSSHSLDQRRAETLHVRGGGVHESHARSSRLSRDDGGVPRRQVEADRADRSARRGRRESRRRDLAESAAGEHAHHLRPQLRMRWCAPSRCSFIRAGASGCSSPTISGTRCSFR